MSGRVFHAPLLASHSKFELYSVLERTKNQAATRYPGIKTHREYRSILDDPAVDLVIVNLPDRYHFDWTKTALEAGKHVVVEKPFTMNLTEAQSLHDLARSKNKQLFVFQNRRWDSDYLTVQRLITEGRLGKVVEFEAHFDRFRPKPTPNTWKEKKDLGTGLLYNLGAHLIDQALVLFGLPDEVFADLSIMRSNSQVCDYVTITMFYPDKRAILRSSYMVNAHPAKFMVHGDQGSFIKSGQDPQEERLNAGWEGHHPELGIEPQSSWGQLYLANNQHAEIVPSETGNYLQFYDGVASDILEQTKSGVDSSAGVAVMCIIEAAEKSQLSRSRVKIVLP